MQDWLASLVKVVETQAEATASVIALNQYIVSDHFVEHCGQVASNAVSAFVLGPFCTNEKQLFFWRRLLLRCFDEIVNSVCEGQNSAAKTTNTGTKACFGVDTAAGALNHRSLLVHKVRLSDSEKKKQTVPLYSNTEAGKFVTRYAELNAHQQCTGYVDGDRYWLWKINAKTLWVLLKAHATTVSPVTRFARVRVVSVVMGDKLMCSCGFFQRHGFPCRHMYMAMREIRVSDFDIRWHLNYFWKYGKEGHQAYTDEVDRIRRSGRAWV